MPIQNEITQRTHIAAKDHVETMLGFANGFIFGDMYLKRNLGLGIRWLGHAVAHGAEDMRLMLEWVQDCEEKRVLPKVSKKPASYASKAASMVLLDNLIGLENVKAQIKSLLNRQNLERLRTQNNLPSQTEFNLHLVFTGNPGTGKTALAQRLGDILADAWMLTLGHVVEVSGTDLIAEYIGSTAPKVEAAVKSALGGILFIDEAYALISHVGVNGRGSSASMIAITTLLTQMNKYKGQFMIIVAGYPEDMKNLMEFNPGFKSRFRETLHFPNFSSEELVQIYMKIAEEKHYILADGSKQVPEKIMHTAPGQHSKSFGNARFVGNLLEETLERVANRVAQKHEVTRDDLITITPFDINDAAKDFAAQSTR